MIFLFVLNDGCNETNKKSLDLQTFIWIETKKRDNDDRLRLTLHLLNIAFLKKSIMSFQNLPHCSNKIKTEMFNTFFLEFFNTFNLWNFVLN